MELDIEKIRKDFPILQQKIYGKPLVYFDNAATTQKPTKVIDALVNYYTTQNSNIHRGVHYLSQVATMAYEEARNAIKSFVNASSANEIIFTRGTTESINIIASSFTKKFISKGDEILISAMEHHSNIVPWQMACEQVGAILKVIPIKESGELILDAIPALLNEKTKILALTHVSNALGTINPIKEIIKLAHQNNTKVLIDGAQSISHMSVDVQDLDCDFYCFSGHKIFGPTGIGVLYGKEILLDQLPPYQGGGDMIKTVSFVKTVYGDLPLKFEAGTQNIADAIALKVAIDYILETGFENIEKQENKLLKYATSRLSEIEGVKFYGTAANKASVVSFLIDNIHPYDAGTIIDKFGVAVRTGHHCTQPLMDSFHIPGTIRASFAFYNTEKEIDVLIEAIKKVKIMFA